MNILIVDDNTTNRMILNALLDDYMDSNSGVLFEVDEAKNGLDAVKQSENKLYDIIFIDINMPVMDGIEACRKIRSKDSKVMLIAVSDTEDPYKRAEILDNGAEDYISKPVDSDIFNSRLKNYILLVESRNKENQSSNVANLYTNKVFSRHTMFMLDSEDSIAEFWEFFLLNAKRKSNHLSDVVRVIVAIVDKQLRLENSSRVYIEESDEKQYFTLVHIDVLAKKVIESLLVKNGMEDGYKLTDKKISFELIKTKQYIDEIKEVSIEEEKIEVVSMDFVSNALQVFDYIEADDLVDLEEYSENLNSLMLLVGGGSLEQNDIIEMCSYLDRVSTLLTPYTEVYAIANAIGELSADLSSHIEEFTKNSQMLGPMCIAFSHDLMTWIRQSFHTGAPSVEFMNDTIVVNAQTIASMLKMDESAASDDNFDDIFDF